MGLEEILNYKQFKQVNKHKMIVATTKEEIKKAISKKQEQYIKYINQKHQNKGIPCENTSSTKNSNSLMLKNINIGLIPTMGALHNGHKSLIEESIKQNIISIVSIFVNPTQFAPTEDLDKYPRTLDRDLELCNNLGVDIVFAPTKEIMYEDTDEVSIEPPKKTGYILEGYYRPTHFKGVLQIVLKLFNLIMPTNAYFGKKDAQQLLIIKQMVRHLFIPIKIIAMPIVRDNDGLALSSRNVYLSIKDREKALAIPKTIYHIESLIKQQNETDIKVLKKEALKILKNTNINYLDFYKHNLSIAKEAKNCIFLLAVKVGNIRLLDNLWIE